MSVEYVAHGYRSDRKYLERESINLEPYIREKRVLRQERKQTKQRERDA
jgi:hypothetical protein